MGRVVGLTSEASVTRNGDDGGVLLTSEHASDGVVRRAGAGADGGHERVQLLRACELGGRPRAHQQVAPAAVRRRRMCFA
eukprot:3355751-Rhodomonas_salina.1